MNQIYATLVSQQVDSGITMVILKYMKTAISIPDPIFEAAENMAQHLGISRSELFSTAVSEYMRNHKYHGVKESLNQVYAKQQSSVDEALLDMQSHSIQKDDW